MIFALNFGLFNEFGEYLVTVGHSVAFLFPLLLKFGTADTISTKRFIVLYTVPLCVGFRANISQVGETLK